MDPKEYSSLKEQVLKRVGFYDLVDEVVGEHAKRAAFQTSGNKLGNEFVRLEELRGDYKRCSSAALIHSQWAGSFASSIDLKRFRADSPFMWQYRDANVPLSYIATYLAQLASPNADLLEKCTEDGSFGVYSVPFEGTLLTRDRLDSVTEIAFLRTVFGLSDLSRFSILDIGSGYGRLAWRLDQCFPQAKMLCVDAIPESAFLCEYHLHFRGVSESKQMVSLPVIRDRLSVQPVDFAVALNSLSECTAAATEWWLDLIAEFSVPYLLFVPHRGDEEGRELYSCESPGAEKIRLVPLLQSRGYRRVMMEPKYPDEQLQKYGISPTYYHLFSKAK